MRTGNLVLGTLLVLAALWVTTWTTTSCQSEVRNGRNGLAVLVEGPCQEARPMAGLAIPLLGLGVVSLALTPLGRRWRPVALVHGGMDAYTLLGSSMAALPRRG